jgi:hypothetical protein
MSTLAVIGTSDGKFLVDASGGVNPVNKRTVDSIDDVVRILNRLPVSLFSNPTYGWLKKSDEYEVKKIYENKKAYLS